MAATGDGPLTPAVPLQSRPRPAVGERPRRSAHATWVAVVAALAATLSIGAGSARAQGPSDADAGAHEQPAAPPSDGFTRWVDLQTVTALARFRYLETSQHVVTTRQVQDSVGLRARLKVDRRGRFSVTGAAGTGASFTSSWNNTGIGTGDAVHTMALKQLFLSAVPVDGVEVSYGGLAPARGESTEITSYDNDGYLVGERVSVRRPQALFFNEISGTAAFLGDLETTNVFRRLDRLDQVNYGQILVSRKATSWLTASADVTRASRASTVRAAASIAVHGPTAVDTIRYEQYARTGRDGAFGFAVTAEKTPLPRLTLGLGYADIDRLYGGLNGDRYNRGRRVFGTSTVRVSRELSLLVFATQAFHNRVAISNHTRFDIVLTYNALPTLKRAGLTR